EKEKAELKKKRELEEKKIKEAEAKAEKLKAEDKARQQKIAEEKKVAENNRREKELADAMNAEETAKQASKDQELINRISNNIKRSIESKFNKVGLPDDLECELRVRLVPGGDVIDVTIAKSSGHDIFDRRAVNATQKASPLPVPDDVETFERLDLREIKLYFKPTN
ncbi:MAG: cell envelope integrity protein TolA, partial [Gammaproteobacteria bacterium]